MVTEIILETALKDGQKAGCKFMSKLATSITSVLIGKKIVSEVGNNDIPIEAMSSEEAAKVATARTIRDTAIVASISMVGTIAHAVISAGIEATQ